MTGTRARILEATSTLFMERGYTASGLKQIAETSAAPIGSLYHFFPGGKAELAAETLTVAGRAYQALVDAVFDAAPDVVAGMRDCFDGAAQALRASDYADACPIATVALEVASSDDALRQVTATIFDSWLDAAAARLARAGVEPARARELAIVFVAALEGGFLLSRAARDTTPMTVIGASVVELVGAAVATGRQAG